MCRLWASDLHRSPTSIGQNQSAVKRAGTRLIFASPGRGMVLILQHRYLSRRRFATAALRNAPPLALPSGWRMAFTAYGWGMVLLAP